MFTLQEGCLLKSSFLKLGMRLLAPPKRLLFLSAATEIHSAFRGRLMSLLVLAHFRVSPRPQLPQESPCISFASIGLLYIICVMKRNSVVAITSQGEWRAVDSCGNKGFWWGEHLRAVPARVRRPRRVGFSRQVKFATSCRNTCTSTSCASKAMGRAHGKRLPGTITDGSKSTRLWK
ncbi:hypothetical protein J2Z83_002498 [Virgibacillus natechei]|uniref:Uncharacterized protein n=1 Tax=Virgibacillus natechei TaxID=1216297 RepID=A0ABS4IHI2_9BACI|nr:hypothetical protein [Virgibacillus natechei]